MGNTTHDPSIPHAGQDVVVQTETLPSGAGDFGFTLYGVNSNWSGAWLEPVAGEGSNDLWRGKIGRFSQGDAVEYLVGIVDGLHTNYDNNGGSNFTFTVTNGFATTWIGDIYHWPANGTLTSASNLWLNLFAAPSQTLVNAFAAFSVNGTLWESAALEFWRMSGSNEWWRVDLGSFPPSSLVWYSFEATDGAGTMHVRPANGAPYFATVAGTATDSDADGLADDWEEYWFGALTNATGAGNPDGDGLADFPMDNQLEYALGTDPDYSNAVDAVRVLWKPSLPVRGGAAKFSVGVGTQEDLYAESIAMDLDLGAGGTAQVGLNPEENGRFEGVALLATNASRLHVVQLSSSGGANDNRGIGWNIPIAVPGEGILPDADQDGLPDGWEFQFALDPFDSADVDEDADADGYSNGDEYVAGRNPQSFYDRPGCVAAYLMNETNWIGTGAVKDASGLENHGTTTNGATTATDAFGTHGLFDGASFVSVPNSSSLQVTGDLTISFWIDMTGAPSVEGPFLSKNGTRGEFGLYVGTSRQIDFYHGGPQGGEGWTLIDGDEIVPGKWFHVVVTRNAASREIRAYLNGQPAFSDTYKSNERKHPVASGAPLIVGQGLKGLMDEVVIENRTWSANEIQAIYDADGDGLPGLWEEANGLDPADSADAGEDPDSDGFSTYREYCEGTNPFDASNHPGGVRARYLMNEPSWTGAAGEVVDGSGLGNHGTAVNGATTLTDAYGTYGMFNGQNSVVAPNSNGLQLAGDLTLSCWLKMTNNPLNGYFLSKGGNLGEFGLFVGANRNMGFHQGNPEGGEEFAVVPGADIAKGPWYHLAVTRNSTNREIRAYLNGARVFFTNYAADVARQPSASTAPLVMGTGLKGLMDEVVVENRVWSSNEVFAAATRIPLVITCPDFCIIDCDADALPEHTGAATLAEGSGAGYEVAYADEIVGSSISGMIYRTWSGRDSLWNTATCTQMIARVDRTAPVLSGVPADESVSCDAIPAPAEVSAVDLCDPAVVVEFGETNDTVAGAGTIVRIWTARDSSGNSTSAVQTIAVADTIPPVLLGVPADATASCDAIPVPAGVTASDTCDPAVTVMYSETNDVAAGSGTIVRTWTATDASGNSASAIQTITVVDTTPPMLAGVPADATASCDAIPVPAGVTASDTCDPAVTVMYSETNDVAAGSGTIVRTWTATDASGNSASAIQTITVVDITPPMLAGVPADETVPCDAIPAPAEVTATDDCDPAVAVAFSEANGVADGVGTIVRTWTATDAGGNSAGATQTITVADTVAPTLACPADATVCAGATDPRFAGTATATDNCDGSPDVAYGDAEAAGGAEGVVLVEWTFPGSPDDATADGGTAANATNQISTAGGTGAVGFSQAGATTRCANATGWNEGSGTKAWQVECSAAGYRNLKVSSKQRSSSTGPRDFKLQCSLDGSAWIDVADVPAVADNFTAGVLAEQALPAAMDGQERIFLRWVMRSNASAGGGTTAGTGNSRIDDVRIAGDEGSSGRVILRTWTATDAAGNVAVATQTIAVADSAPMLIGVPADETVPCDAIPAPAEVTATDDCDPAVAVAFSEANGVADGVGTIVRTWTATDAGGNSAGATQTITVADTVAPTLACPADATVCAGATDPRFAGTATATDNCDGSPDVAYGDAEAAGGAEGVVLVEWTFPGSPDDATADGGTAANATNQISTAGGTGAVGFSQAGATTRCANATGWNEGSGTKAWQVECSAAGYRNLKVSSKQRSSSTGPRDFKLQCSLDGSAWIDVADVPAVADNFTAGVLAEQALPAAMDGQERIFLRWVMRSNASAGGGTTAGTGNSRIDDVRIAGDEGSSGRVILRTWTATDAAGNVAVATQTIAVADSMPLAISCPPDATVECGEPTDPAQTGIATATDPCGASNAVSYSDAIASGSAPGIQEVISRTWTATGSAGRMAICTQTITVVDAVPPAIICPPDVTLACGAPTDPSHTGFATATDACSASNTITYGDDSGNAPGSEAYEVILRTWTATDAAGNASVSTQTISIIRLSIICPPDATVECGNPTEPSHTGIATVSAACGATNIVVAYEDEVDSQPGSGAHEIIVRTWSATDVAGNVATAVQTITVTDTTPPVLVGVPSNAFLRCGDPIPEPGAIGVTDCDTNVDLSYEAVTNGTCPAVITRTWTARDSRGNETTAVQLVSIYGPVRNLTSGEATFGTLQETIDAANVGDVIGIRQGAYLLAEPANLKNGIDLQDGPIVLKKGVKLQGGYDENWEMTGGPESTVLDGGGLVRCLTAVDLTEPCEVANLTMQHGEADRGGAVLIVNSAVSLRDCVIAQNHATQGGSMFCSKRANIDLVNCLVVQNSANQDAGISAPLCFGRLRFQNCTFMANADTEGRSATLHVGEWLGSPARFTDSILWNAGAAHELNSYPCTVMEISHCVVQGGAPPGLGNLSADPAFANEAEGDAHLLPISSAIDAGSKSALDVGLDGNSGYGTNPDGVQGDVNQLDIGFHYKGY